MKKIVSLSCSGEALEKVLSLYSTTKETNSRFYEQFEVVLFYGHNLPKKHSENAVCGTLGFYCAHDFLGKWLPTVEKGDFLRERQFFLQQLLNQGRITDRAGERLENCEEDYWLFMQRLPIEYIYPYFYNRLIKNASRILSVSLKSLYLEKNYIRVLDFLSASNGMYKVYGLDYTGKIAKFSLQYEKKNKSHFYTELGKRAVLSGNSALFLTQISERFPKDAILGYRAHKTSVRPNREYAFEKEFFQKEKFLEPPNETLFKYLHETGGEIDLTFAKAYGRFLDENSQSLELN